MDFYHYYCVIFTEQFIRIYIVWQCVTITLCVLVAVRTGTGGGEDADGGAVRTGTEGRGARRWRGGEDRNGGR